MPRSLKRYSRHGALDRRDGSRYRTMAIEVLEHRRVLSIGPLLVDADSVAQPPDGLTWPTAYADLQAALDQAELLNTDADPENDVTEIWIAEGTYKPTTMLYPTVARSATFSLLDGVSLYGSFAGDEQNRNSRHGGQGAYPFGKRGMSVKERSFQTEPFAGRVGRNHQQGGVNKAEIPDECVFQAGFIEHPGQRDRVTAQFHGRGVGQELPFPADEHAQNAKRRPGKRGAERSEPLGGRREGPTGA